MRPEHGLVTNRFGFLYTGGDTPPFLTCKLAEGWGQRIKLDLPTGHVRRASFEGSRLAGHLNAANSPSFGRHLVSNAFRVFAAVCVYCFFTVAVVAGPCLSGRGSIASPLFAKRFALSDHYCMGE